MSGDVPVLTFTEEEETFWITIVYPNDDEDRYALGSNYDSAIEKYLVMVNAYRHSSH